jgi:hypothetical protein
MPRNRIGLNFTGYAELLQQYDRIGGNLKKITEEMLTESHKKATPGIHAAMQRHRKTGKTEDAIIDTATVTWQGNIAGIDIGFDISNGGLPSVFLMYGTPRAQKDTKLYNSVYGRKLKQEVGALQKEILDREMQRLSGN